MEVVLTGILALDRINSATRGRIVSKPAVGSARSSSETSITKLARFFRDATPVRIPVRLTREIADGPTTETTVIEFGTPREVLFTSNLPLQFADRLRVQNSDGTLNVEASVVALQHHRGRTAVAARFTHDVGNWIVKP
ncbi:MAG TPA: hypothetical protein VFA68_02570 [Terriglobales bacterium]|nr:hypothetical protein [Terriglobales bacterium]